MIPEIMDIIVKVLNKERDHSREIVEAIIDSEQNYLFTNDQNYKDNRTDIVPTEQNNPQLNRENSNGQPGGPGGPAGASQNQFNQQAPVQRGANVFVTEMRKRIDAYFEIVLRNVKDSIPKAIGFFLVKKSQEVLQFELYN